MNDNKSSTAFDNELLDDAHELDEVDLDAAEDINNRFNESQIIDESKKLFVAPEEQQAVAIDSGLQSEPIVD